MKYKKIIKFIGFPLFPLIAGSIFIIVHFLLFLPILHPFLLIWGIIFIIWGLPCLLFPHLFKSSRFSSKFSFSSTLFITMFMGIYLVIMGVRLPFDYDEGHRMMYWAGICIEIIVFLALIIVYLLKRKGLLSEKPSLIKRGRVNHA